MCFLGVKPKVCRHKADGGHPNPVSVYVILIPVRTVTPKLVDVLKKEKDRLDPVLHLLIEALDLSETP